MDLIKSLCMCLVFLAIHTSSFSQSDYPLYRMLGKTKPNCKECSGVTSPQKISKSNAPLELLTSDLESKDFKKIESFKQIGESQTTAGLVLVRGNHIVYEKYADGASKDDLMVSFSRAKSLISIAIGRSYCQGKIKSLDDSLEIYLEDLRGTPYGKSKISSLLEMSSGTRPGLASGEASPGETQKWIKGEKSVKQSLNEFNQQVTGEGTYAYKNIDTIALTLLLQKVNEVEPDKWFFQTVWDPIGADSDALWALDKNGIPLGSSIFLATNRDWARVGIYVNRMLRNETADICMADYLKKATSKKKSTDNKEFNGYGYQIWTDHADDSKHQIFWFRGVSGQLVAMHPQSNSVMVLTSLNDSMATTAARAFINWSYP